MQRAAGTLLEENHRPLFAREATMNALNLHAEPLQDAWLDAYGHLNEAYYLVPFSRATWAYQNHFGIGDAFLTETGGALYTVETHLRYLRDVRAPAQIEIETYTLACDAKRLHIAHRMLVDETERATFECIGVHVDSKVGKTAPWPAEVLSTLSGLCLPEADWPEWSGRRVSMKRNQT